MGRLLARRTRNDSQLVSLIKNVPLFSSCNEKQLRSIATSGKEVSFEEKRTIFKEGDIGVGLLIILEGEVKVLVGKRTRRRLGPGAFFGEISLLDGEPRSATVVTETPVRAFAITLWNFRSVLKEHPSLPLKMLEEVAKRLRDNERSLSN
jgi:CRP/FNR family transcriptional regulator, cyclic AMP receptor protein